MCEICLMDNRICSLIANYVIVNKRIKSDSAFMDPGIEVEMPEGDR